MAKYLYEISPAGGYSPRVWTWPLRSGVRCSVGAGAHRGAAVCALLPRAPLAAGAALLTLAADSLYVRGHPRRNSSSITDSLPCLSEVLERVVRDRLNEHPLGSDR